MRHHGYALLLNAAGRLLLGAVLLLAGGCRQDMADQPRYLPLQASELFPDRASARPLPPGTVPLELRGQDPLFLTGRTPAGELVRDMPGTVTLALLQRGQTQYNVFCSPCHDRVGTGRGMIVQRGFTAPPSYHEPRLVNAPDGHFFDVITNGFGVMYSYADRVRVADRWAIIAYIRALELSQNAPIDAVPPPRRALLERNRP